MRSRQFGPLAHWCPPLTQRLPLGPSRHSIRTREQTSNASEPLSDPALSRAGLPRPLRTMVACMSSKKFPRDSSPRRSAALPHHTPPVSGRHADAATARAHEGVGSWLCFPGNRAHSTSPYIQINNKYTHARTHARACTRTMKSARARRGGPVGLEGQDVELAVGVEADRDLKQAPARARERACASAFVFDKRAVARVRRCRGWWVLRSRFRGQGGDGCAQTIIAINMERCSDRYGALEQCSDTERRGASAATRA